jgi:hypothetical protein
MKKALFLFWCVAMTASPTMGQETFYFENISKNNPLDADIGQNQLSFVVSSGTGGQVLFKFLNKGPDYCKIEEVYFDDNANLLSKFSLIDVDNGIAGDPYVDFSPGANPGNLPAGHPINFYTTPNLLTQADKGKNSQALIHNKAGVEPGQKLGILFSLQQGKTYDDTIAALKTSDLRVGIHVTSFISQGSESFVSNNSVTVPIPASIALASIGAMFIGFCKKRFKA